MKRFRSALTLSAVTFFAATSFHGPVWAVDANAFTSRVQENMKQNGWTISASKSEEDGKDIVLHDVTIKLPASDGAKRPTNQDNSSAEQSEVQKDVHEQPAVLTFDKLESLRFKNVTEDQDGNYFAESLSIPELKGATSNVTYNLKNIVLDKLKLASDKTTDPMILYFPYDSMKVEQIYLTHDDQSFVNIDHLMVKYTPQPGTKITDFTATINSFSYEPEKTGIPDASSWLKTVGYEKLSGSVATHAKWDLESGKFSGDDNRITIDNAGKLNFNIDIDGINEELVKNIAELKKAKLSQQADENALAIGYLGIIQQLKLGNIKIRYDDNSLTNRILDYYAQQNGVSREDFIKQVKATLPALATQIDHPDFIKNTSNQLGTFLDNPKSLTVSATPAKSIPLPILIATGSTSAAKLIDLLNIKVKANN